MAVMIAEQVLDRLDITLATMQAEATASGFGAEWANLPYATRETQADVLREAWAKRHTLCAQALEAAMACSDHLCALRPDWKRVEFWARRVEEYAAGFQQRR